MDAHTLTMLMYEVAEAASEQTLIQAGLITEYMDRAEAYRRVGNKRATVDKAILSETLPYIMKGDKLLIKRTDFKKWINKNHWS